MITIQDVGRDKTAFGGSILMTREFFNPETKDYLCIEAHERCCDPGSEEIYFEVAFWVPDGNDGDHRFAGSIYHVVRCMQEYVPPADLIEMAIPEDAWC
jgi:hypothetical protein